MTSLVTKSRVSCKYRSWTSDISITRKTSSKSRISHKYDITRPHVSHRGERHNLSRNSCVWQRRRHSCTLLLSSICVLRCMCLYIRYIRITTRIHKTHVHTYTYTHTHTHNYTHTHTHNLSRFCSCAEEGGSYGVASVSRID